MLQVGPCEPWPVDFDCTTCREVLPDYSPAESPDDPVTDALIRKWSMVATEILWHLSGMRWGPCPVTVRPCKRSCLDQLGVTARWGTVGSKWVPYIDGNGVWRNASPCSCGDSCSCGEICEVKLAGPVHDIVEVRVDGAELDPAAYRVDAPNLLVRTDGECWPTCSDMLANCDEPGAFCVTYNWGLPLTEGAKAAASELTCEFLKLCPEIAPKDCRCRLPGNVTRVVRQGVQVELEDPTTIFAEGRTGLTITDAWLNAVNPGRITSPPRVLSPDRRMPRVQQWL